jgi:PAS domain S-box-containing protein
MPAGNKVTERIIALLRQSPKGMGITEISRKLHIHRNGVAKYLEMLRVSGQVRMNTVGMAKIYAISQRMPVSAMSALKDDPSILIDQTGKIIQANEAYCGLCGKAVDEIIGRKIGEPDLIFVNDAEILSIINKQDSQELIRSFSYPLEYRPRYFRLRIFPVLLEEGDTGIVLIGGDITKEKELEMRLSALSIQYNSIIDQQPVMICRFLPDYVIKFTNKPFRDIFTVREPDEGGLYFFDTVTFDPRNEVSRLIESCADSRIPIIHEYPVPFTNEEEEVYWQRWSYSPIFDTYGTLSEIHATGVDISREKYLEKNIQQHERDLEFISRKALDFIELPQYANIYEKIGEDSRILVPGAVISVSVFEKATSSITVRSFIGDDEGVFTRYFRNMIGLNMPIMDKEVVAVMASGTLHKVPGGVHICTFGQIPVYSSEKIERDLPLKCIYSLGLVSGGELLCVVTLFMHGSDTIDNPDLFIAYIRQATIAFQSRHIEAK